jgi:hypothetical protein
MAGTTSGSNSLQFQASWEPDIFGGIRKNVASYSATLQSQQENLRDVMVTLAGGVLREIQVRRAFLFARLPHLELRNQRAKVLITLPRLAEKWQPGGLGEMPVREPGGRGKAAAQARHGDLRPDMRAHRNPFCTVSVLFSPLALAWW